jgi:hypothetical protein
VVREPPQRGDPPRLGHERRIRDYLRFKSLDAVHRELLERHLRGLAKDGLLPNEIYAGAEKFLRERSIILPGRVRLERFVAGVLVRAEAAAHEQIRERLTPEFCAAIDAFLKVPENERRSPLAGFKEYPRRRRRRRSSSTSNASGCCGRPGRPRSTCRACAPSS